MNAYIHARVFTGRQMLEGKTLVVDGKRVRIADDVPAGASIVDCRGLTLAPGFIDLQIYGAGGYLFSASLTPESLHHIADDLVRRGTTGFYITLATNTFDVYQKAIDIVKAHPHPAVLGVHLEGPYINPEKRGAHIPACIVRPDPKHLEGFLEDADGVIKMMTVAPEQCDARALELLQRYGVLLSAGHSNATFDEAVEGFNAGIRAATHLFNAMSPLHHRDPGLPGAVFVTPSVASSIIPDGIHVHFEIAKMAHELLRERLFFITDAVTETTEGGYIHIRKDDRFTLPDGTLSGSALTMPLAVKNGVEKMGLDIEESLKKASLYPAVTAGLSDAGLLHDGSVANFVALDQALDLGFTVFQGKLIRP